MNKNNFILIGFDRSGTSAISRTLAAHPEVELIFRPFNSGPIRKKMYHILDDITASVDDVAFFEALERGVLKADYFVSQWHLKYSTVKDTFASNRLHAIITNINHFTVRWVRRRFPLIEQWAIWRDPVDILNSCIKNDFFKEWYGSAIDQLVKSVVSDPQLSPFYSMFAKKIQEENEVVKTAFLISVRNYFLFANIPSEKVIDYDLFRTEPNVALRPAIKYFGLRDEFDFTRFLEIDLNSVPSIDGYSKGKTSNIVLDSESLAKVTELFEPLYSLYNQDKRTNG